MTRFVPAALVLVALLAAPVSMSSAPPSKTAVSMADAANAFLKDLTPEQRSKATFAFEDDSRFEFRFTPRARTGLPIKEMTEAQRAKAHALLKTGLSMRGYTTATTIMDLENVLHGDRVAAHRAERDRPRPRALLRLDLRHARQEPVGLEVGRPPRRHQLHHRRGRAGRDLAELLRVESCASCATARRRAFARWRAKRIAGRELLNAFQRAQRTKVMYETTAPREMLTAESREVKPLTGRRHHRTAR